MEIPRRYHIELQADSEDYRCLVGNLLTHHREDRGTAELGSHRTVPNAGWTLGDILDRLTNFDVAFLRAHFDERQQLHLGNYLYQQTLGKLPVALSPTDTIELTIHSSDEHILRLPWALIAHRGQFLCRQGVLGFNRHSASGPDQ
jgi:hypothetical protein